MNRLDPVDSEDGMGTQHIDLMAGFKGKWHWDPFREGVLQDAVKNGVGV